MLLDIGTVLGGIGLAVVAFVVVILVCVVILRLLAAILPSYEDRDAREVSPEPDSPDEDAPSSPARVPEGTEDRRE
jgi:Na+-transporting methylmalonyl-CoA/oxaloacetate decarboxylase gamma subunit